MNWLNNSKQIRSFSQAQKEYLYNTKLQACYSHTNPQCNPKLRLKKQPNDVFSVLRMLYGQMIETTLIFQIKPLLHIGRIHTQIRIQLIINHRRFRISTASNQEWHTTFMLQGQAAISI